MNTTNSKANEGSQIINALLTASQGVDNAELRFVIYMFENEVTYSKAWANQLLKAEGSAKTQAIDKAIANVSDDIRNMLADAETLGDLKNKSQSQKDRLMLINRKLKAVREMFKRATHSLYYMRAAGIVTAKFESDKGCIKVQTAQMKADSDSERMSRGELQRAGTERFKSDNGLDNPKGSTTQTDPAAADKANVQVIQGITKFIRNAKDITDLSDELHAAVTDLFLSLTVAHFQSEGAIEMKEVKEFFKGALKDVKIA